MIWDMELQNINKMKNLLFYSLKIVLQRQQVQQVIPKHRESRYLDIQPSSLISLQS